MRRTVLYCAALAAIACVLSTLRAADEPAAATPAPTASSSSDEEQIRGTAQKFVEAYNAGDAAAIGALFAADADYIDEDGTLISGRDAITEDFTAFFAESPGRTLKINITALRFLTPDVAIEDGTLDVTPVPPGPPSDRRYSAVHVKRDGAWLVASVRDSRTVRESNYTHLKELEWLVGDWIDESDESLIETSCHWDENKNYLIRTFKAQIEGVRVSSGVQRIGWDPGKRQIRSWLFDAEGGFGDGLWTRDGDTWTIRSTGMTPEGDAGSAVNIITRIDDNKLTWTSTQRSIGGEPLEDVESVTVVRKPPAPK